MFVAQAPQIASEVANIRAQIQQFGESRVGSDKLSVLRPENSTTERLTRVAAIAEWEHWSFELLPTGEVLFRARSSPKRHS